VLLVVVDHQLVEPMVVVIADMVEQHLLHMDYLLKKSDKKLFNYKLINFHTTLLCCCCCSISANNTSLNIFH
jgi:hypothetical protein